MLIITFELKSMVKCPFDIKKYLLYISPWTYVFSLNKLNYSERKKIRYLICALVFIELP